MKTATITETKNHLSALLHDVQRGETVVVLDRKRPVARIEPVNTDAVEGSDARISRLQKAGVLLPPRENRKEEVLSTPPVCIGQASAVHALLEERESGR